MRCAEQLRTLILESCGIEQTPGDFGGTVISQTPYSFFFIGWDVLSHPSAGKVIMISTFCQRSAIAKGVTPGKVVD